MAIVFGYALASVGSNKAYVEYWNPVGSGVAYRLLRLEARKGNVEDAIDVIAENAQFDVTPTGGLVRYDDIANLSVPPLLVAAGNSSSISTATTIYAFKVGGGSFLDPNQIMNQSFQRPIPILLRPGTGFLVAPANSGAPLEVATILEELTYPGMSLALKIPGYF